MSAWFLDSELSTCSHVSTCGYTRNLQCNPVISLHGPRFLMAWNIQISCNILYAKCEIAIHGVASLRKPGM